MDNKLLLKEKINILQLLTDEGLELKQQYNGDHLALCPFHNEKTPSFRVREQHQSYHCFGCGEKGDIFDFIMNKYSLTFPQAITHLADKYNIPLEKENNQDNEDTIKLAKEIKEARKLLKELETYFKETFKQLSSSHLAKTNITDRGLPLTDEYGYAPSSGEIISFIQSKKGIALARELGLIHPDNGLFIQSNRLIFFYYDLMGNCIGFNGRTLEKSSTHKYINSKNNILFHKSKVLFNIDKAKQSARKLETVYLVEGPFDVKALENKGIENVVAVSGTAITQDQVKILQQIIGNTGKIILILDGDDAGLKASYRTFKELKNIQESLWVIAMPKGNDPCEYLQTHNELPKPVLYVEFLLQFHYNNCDVNTVSGRHDFIQKVTNNIINQISSHKLKEIVNKVAHQKVNLEVNIIQKQKEVKEDELSYFEKLPYAHKLFVSSLAWYVAHFDSIKKPLGKTKYPQEYHTFIQELNQELSNDIKDRKLYQERFTNKKLAEVVFSIEDEKVEDINLITKHYKHLIEKAVKLYQKERANG